MTDYTVRATITVSGQPGDEAKIRAAVEAGLAELPSLATRYGFTVTSTDATVDEG
jgi:hypothetical protein